LKFDSYAYLKDVFERLPLLANNLGDSTDRSALIPLLPDHWLATHLESHLPQRVTKRIERSQAFDAATTVR